MTASPPKVNGHARPPALQVMGDWQPIGATPTEHETTKPPTTQIEPTTVNPDVIAQAEAEAIRARAWAESEERRLAAETEKEAALKRADAEADAIRAKAVEDARKAKLVNDKAEQRYAEEQAAREARIAESHRKREEAERAAAAAAEQDEIDRQAEAEKAKVVAKADNTWRGWAIGFYALCAAVALPVQISAFWNPAKPWMAGAPVLLEIAALVVAFGTAAAVANKRPHWHFRLITWVLAFIAAAVNFGHGITEFDLATAIGTALASVFGPGVWDLHEHGRIRKRDGVLTRRERKEREKAAKAEAKQKAADEAQRAAEKQAAAKAAKEAAAKLAADREQEFPNVWKHALRLAAALGETTVTEAVWRRAHLDIEGTDPGESAETIRARNVAAKRVELARNNTSVNTLSKTTNAQRASHLPSAKKTRTYSPPARPGRRTKGDSQPFVNAARKQAAITAQNSRPNDI